MKILFVCHRLPFPPKRGGKIRPFNIIRHLKESGHSVTVGSLARSEEELEEGQPLREYCDKLIVGRVNAAAATARMIARLPTAIPSSMGYFYSPGLHREIKKELQQDRFDLVFVHCSSVAQYVSSANGVPSILDFGDMDSQKWLDYSSYRRFPLSMGYWIEGTKLCREEKRLARRFDLSTCTTHAELKTLRSFDAARQTDWFPNGVDAAFFSPTEEPYDRNQVCFIGRMDYYPNQQAMLNFCNSALPLIQLRRPATKLTIVGAEPSAEIRKLAEKPGVTVTGTVPDVRDYVRGSALSVAPLAIARGTQNKILESMAMGVPVICSKAAAGGVDAVPGRHLLVAESPEQYTDHVIRLLEKADERKELSIAARQRVVSSHSWPASMTKLDGIIASVARSVS
ncbi:MAG: TIGR03087 family PEP-CTERM/XrtA system glycosyltransferase [Woeseiaceae bacterium]|nr:TIGR03087 family PEP-CTERM/XrtA system glycosyltransferase [Woeseiaceae bacterium]